MSHPKQKPELHPGSTAKMVWKGDTLTVEFKVRGPHQGTPSLEAKPAATAAAPSQAQKVLTPEAAEKLFESILVVNSDWV
jgi:hypothetical protein